MKYKCRPIVTTTIIATITITTTVTSTCNLSICHYIQPVTDQPIQFVIVTNTQLDPLTWIIYQGHLSTRCPTSPTHASTKHVPRSPTYHHKTCVSTMYQIMYENINLYHTKHQPCTKTRIITIASMMKQLLYQTVH